MHGYGCGMGNQIHLSPLSLFLYLTQTHTLSLFLYLSISIYLSLFNYRSRFICTDMDVGWVIRFISPLSLSLSLFIYISISPSHYLPLYNVLPVYCIFIIFINVILHIFLSLSLSLYFSIYLSLHLIISLSP